MKDINNNGIDDSIEDYIKAENLEIEHEISEIEENYKEADMKINKNIDELENVVRDLKQIVENEKQKIKRLSKLVLVYTIVWTLILGVLSIQVYTRQQKLQNMDTQISKVIDVLTRELNVINEHLGDVNSQIQKTR